MNGCDAVDDTSNDADKNDDDNGNKISNSKSDSKKIAINRIYKRRLQDSHADKEPQGNGEPPTKPTNNYLIE